MYPALHSSDEQKENDVWADLIFGLEANRGKETLRRKKTPRAGPEFGLHMYWAPVGAKK